MSRETVTWAKKQFCGCSTAKAVLLELASWSRSDGFCEFRRLKDIARTIEVSERSVQRALLRLEGDIQKGWPALIRRIPRTGKDGGRRANCFELIGFDPSDTVSPPHATVAPAWRRSVRGGGDRAVTPYMNLDSVKDRNTRSEPAAESPSSACEDDRVLRLCTALQKQVSPREWQCWVAPLVFVFADPGLKVFAPSEASREGFEFRFARLVSQVLEGLHLSVSWMTFEVDLTVCRSGSPRLPANLEAGDHIPAEQAAGGHGVLS